jgi:hypothetical protein
MINQRTLAKAHLSDNRCILIRHVVSYRGSRQQSLGVRLAYSNAARNERRTSSPAALDDERGT